MKRLLIVESPTKAGTIGRMLPKDYKVMASMGHVRDLPEHSFGVDIEHNFTPEYVSTPRSSGIIKQLKSACADADEIYLAPDPDREGEAIAWHLESVLKSKKDKRPFHRVAFHEITRSAIERALQEPGKIDLARVDAQQARRVLDRIVGYMVSPLLWAQVEKGISAGRVQSVALRLIVERERAILDFKPEEYWVFSLLLEDEHKRQFKVTLFKVDGKKFQVGNAAAAAALLDAVLAGSVPRVESIESAPRKRFAPPPFTTSTLQQAANTMLHFQTTTTMRCAQQLYEGIALAGQSGGSVGLITYMRTDSVTLSKEAQAMAHDFILANYGGDYVPDKPNYFKNKAAAQEAHEAIRPTDVNRTPEMLAGSLDPMQLKLYTLIWKRFVASQMTPQISEQMTLDVLVAGSDGKAYDFRAASSVVRFPGFSKVFRDEKEDSDPAAQQIEEIFRSLRTGQKLAIGEAHKDQKFTEPPSHYTEATLIKELEENGIGRPSTYATIIKTIQQRNYVTRDKAKLVPTELGFKVTDFLVSHLPDIFNVSFTAGMEQQLDDVENGSVEWTGMVGNFYERFKGSVEAVKDGNSCDAALAGKLIQALADVQFQTAEKGGGRVFDDGKFYRSIQRQYEKDGKLSLRQFDALISICGKYRAQIHAELPAEVEAGIAAAEERYRSRDEARKAGPGEALEKLFAAFASVTWAEPVKRGNRTYDDKKFFDSLREQAVSGKPLSEKQLAALNRMAAKYQLGSSVPGGEAGGATAAENAPTPEVTAEIARLFEQMSHVTVWAEPVKKGRFTYDDKAFYESLLRQHKEGRNLSFKQLAALRKMAGKYHKETVETA
ncbi:MAG: type I DNA topoisomerase [Victivallaceae bacterium]|nr:type I DNA topoisomerase [Victivallaceae bacterium]